MACFSGVYLQAYSVWLLVVDLSTNCEKNPEVQPQAKKQSVKHADGRGRVGCNGCCGGCGRHGGGGVGGGAGAGGSGGGVGGSSSSSSSIVVVVEK